MGQQNKSSFSLHSLSEIGFARLKRVRIFGTKAPCKLQGGLGMSPTGSHQQCCCNRRHGGLQRAGAHASWAGQGDRVVKEWSNSLPCSHQTNLRNIPSSVHQPDPVSVPISSCPRSLVIASVHSEAPACGWDLLWQLFSCS